MLEATGASGVSGGERVQSLWSGFGEIRRLTLDGGRARSAILKRVDPAAGGAHPRGWDGEASRRRKLRSYAVETRWYTGFAARCDARCRVPALLGERHEGHARWLLLEDLDVAYPKRRERLGAEQCLPCLRWLAAFHARFAGDAGEGLWPEGGYWHLATRPDELAAMADSPIRRAASALDRALSDCRYRTLVHGDAKLANFCFDASLDTVAAVDFQYVGGGCGMRDLVYLLGSCLSGEETAAHESALLDVYFDELAAALGRDGRAELAEPIAREWRGLYAIAWTDFQRFLLGWMPTHPKITPYAWTLAERALGDLADRSGGARADASGERRGGGYGESEEK